jgi:drug/metabolite transporter (DMT)-like permease
LVPEALLTCAQGWVPSLDRVAVFSLTSVFAVVLEPYVQGSEPRQGKAALAGALDAVAGILFLLGLDLPRSFRAGAALCLLLAATLGIAATYCLAVRLARNLASPSTLPMAAQACAPAAVCFAADAAFAPHSAWRWSALPLQLLVLFVIDIPALSLLFWLMHRLNASRMRFPFFWRRCSRSSQGRQSNQHRRPFAPGSAWRSWQAAQDGSYSLLPERPN